MPSLSIVTVTKDALPALQETAASLAVQTSRDFEHVIIDGASDDGTANWLSEYKGARWISEPDDGIADALNKAFRLAVGEFVIVLQAGDTLLSERSVEDALHYSQTSKRVDIIAFDVIFGDIHRMGHTFPSLRLEWKPLHHQGVLFRRSLFEHLGPFDTNYRLCMDYELLLRAKRAGARIRRVPYAISRMDPAGISSRRDWPGLRARFAEERRVHLAHCNRMSRLLYGAYWPLYLCYRRARLRVRL